jgi:hypothetical protein
MSTRAVAVRIGVVACVVLAALIGAGRLDDSLAVFDFQADANVALTFSERNYPEIGGLEGWTSVLEDARLWMPDDATYRVIDGPREHGETAYSSLRTYLGVLLMPRRETQVPSGPWVFCYGCGPSTLGAEYEVLSDSGHGLLFARRRS